MVFNRSVIPQHYCEPPHASCLPQHRPALTCPTMSLPHTLPASERPYFGLPNTTPTSGQVCHRRPNTAPTSDEHVKLLPRVSVLGVVLEARIGGDERILGTHVQRIVHLPVHLAHLARRVEEPLLPRKPPSVLRLGSRYQVDEW